MKITYSIITVILALVCASCERTIDFVENSGETEDDMCISAVAFAGQPFSVFLNQAFPAGEAPSIRHLDPSSSAIVDDTDFSDYQRDDYQRQTAIGDAEVTAEVNGQQTFSLYYDSRNCTYRSSYTPKEGDRIRVTARMGNQELQAETTVPQVPHIEVLGSEELSDNPHRSVNGLEYNTDSLMRLTCRISDAVGNNYYRLRVRSERSGVIKSSVNQGNVRVEVFYLMQDVYFSSDELFVDSRLTSNFGGWPAFFSDVFDDSLMHGGNYTFTIDSPKVPYNGEGLGLITSEAKESNPPLPPRVMIELQAVSPELYRYLKSAQLYRVTASDAYAEPVQIYSNVQNGWGILGALSYDRHFVEYGE